MILTFTFYKMDEKGLEKQFLQSFIIEKEIWKNLDFWKSSIFASIINEAKLQKNYHMEEIETDAEKVIREKNIVFGQLAAFGQNMLMFGIEKKVILHIMHKYFEIYELEETQIENIKVEYIYIYNQLYFCRKYLNQLKIMGKIARLKRNP